MSYTNDGKGITLTLSYDDYASLLLALGMAIGTCSRRGLEIRPWIRLANRINEENPNWIPYNVDEKESV